MSRFGPVPRPGRRLGLLLALMMLPLLGACAGPDADGDPAAEGASGAHAPGGDAAGVAREGTEEERASSGEAATGRAGGSGAGAQAGDAAGAAAGSDASGGESGSEPAESAAAPVPPEMSAFVPLGADPDTPPDAAALGIPLLPEGGADAPASEPATLYRDITWLGLEAEAAADAGAGAEAEGAGASDAEASAEGALWAVWTTGFLGMRNAPHVLGLYERRAEGWQRLAQLALTDAALPEEERGAEPGAPPQPFPPMVDKGSVRQVEQAPPGWIWLSVSGGWGANGGAFQLLGFDGQDLSSLMALMEVFPGSTQVGSLNADDIAYILEDRSDGYVLCRACGVREAGLRIHVFDPGLRAFAPAELAPAPSSWSAGLRERADRALVLAEAGLWMEAARLMNEVERAAASAGNGADPHVWTRETVRLNAEARRALAAAGAEAPVGSAPLPAGKGDALSAGAGDAGDGPGGASDSAGDTGGGASEPEPGDASGSAADADLPAPSIQLMHRMFYGDYAAVQRLMRRYPAAEHFGDAPPLLDANMGEQQLDRIIEETEPALRADPGLVGVWLLRGWALSLRDPGAEEGPMALVRASELAPDDAFIAAMAAEARR